MEVFHLQLLGVVQCHGVVDDDAHQHHQIDRQECDKDALVSNAETGKVGKQGDYADNGRTVFEVGHDGNHDQEQRKEGALDDHGGHLPFSKDGNIDHLGADLGLEKQIQEVGGFPDGEPMEQIQDHQDDGADNADPVNDGNSAHAGQAEEECLRDDRGQNGRYQKKQNTLPAEGGGLPGSEKGFQSTQHLPYNAFSTCSNSSYVGQGLSSYIFRTIPSRSEM